MLTIDYSFVDILISTILALIMFSIGLSLTAKKFRKLFKRPKAVLTGLSAQMILFPVIAFTITLLSNLKPEYKVGLIILAACPGGTTSNFVTYLINGDTELSISLTTINSFITLFSIPVIVNIALNLYLGENASIHLPFLNTILQIFFITIIPASVGIFIKSRYPVLTEILSTQFRIKIFKKKFKVNIIKFLTIVLLGIAFIIMFFAEESVGGLELTKDDIVHILPVGILFNLAGLFIGFVIARLLHLKDKKPVTIGIEVGLQNTTLAFLIAGTLLQNSEMQKPALVYALFSFWTAITFGLIVLRITTKKKTHLQL